jgi:hypothetical protein
MRTARSRSSCGYLPCLVMAPTSHESEPPGIPGRFTALYTVLPAELELHPQTPRMRHTDHVFGVHGKLGESLTAFDPRDAELGTQVQVCRQLRYRFGEHL